MFSYDYSHYSHYELTGYLRRPCFFEKDKDFLESLPLNVRVQTLMQVQKERKKKKKKKQKLEKQIKVKRKENI